MKVVCVNEALKRKKHECSFLFNLHSLDVKNQHFRRFYPVVTYFNFFSYLVDVTEHRKSYDPTCLYSDTRLLQYYNYPWSSAAVAMEKKPVQMCEPERHLFKSCKQNKSDPEIKSELIH